VNALESQPSKAKRAALFVWRSFPVRIVFGLLAFALGQLIAFGIASALGWSDVTWLGSSLIGWLSIPAVLLTYVLFVRVIERRPVSELALGRIGELGIGAAVGAMLFAAIIAVMALLGFYSVTGYNGWGAAANLLWIGLIPGVVEEVLLRGVFHRLLERSLGTWIALVLTSLLFGFLHGANPNATVFSSLAIALEAGTMLGIAYTLTKRLWLPIGLHAAWNWVQGGVFDIAVSGNDVTGLVDAQVSGPELLTGGAFGAEASVIAIVACLIVFGVMTLMAHRRAEIVPVWWRRARGNP
jgi:uncharacterized protein